MVIILLRHSIKRRVVGYVEERQLLWARAIDEVLREDWIPARVPVWRADWDREAADGALLERWRTATGEEKRLLRALFRTWGLFDEHQRKLLRGNRWDQARSALVLARLRFSESLPALLRLLPRAPEKTQVALINSLEMLGEPDACETLVEFLASKGSRRYRPVLSALIACSRRAPEHLSAHLNHKQALVRQAMAQGLAEVATDRELSGLLEAAEDPEPEVRAKVARALGRIPQPDSFEVLKHLANDPVWYVRLQAIRAIESSDVSEVRKVLVEAIQDSHWRVRAKAALALHHRVQDSASLLRLLREEVGDRFALDAVVTALEREGATWRAIGTLAPHKSQAADANEQAESRAMLLELLRAKKWAALLYALENHPDKETRNAILNLLREHDDRTLAPSLKTLLGSSLLGLEMHREVQALVEHWEM